MSGALYAPGWSFRAPQSRQALPPDPGNLLADFNPLYYPDNRPAGASWAGVAPAVVNPGGGAPASQTFNGSSNNVAAATPPVVDHSAAIPYTVYVVVRPSAADVAGTGGSRTICSTSVEGNSLYYWAFYFIAVGLRLIVAENGLLSLNDKAIALVEGQTYVIAIEFASLTELNIWVDGVEDSATVTSRDPGDFNAFSWGRRAAGTGFYSSPTLLRGLVYSGAYSATVATYLAGLYQ